MADFIHSSNPAIQTLRKFPSDCGPSAPKTGAAFNSPIQPPKSKKPGPAGNRSSSCRKPVLGGDSSIRIRVSGLLKLFRKRCREMMKSNVYSPRADLKVYLEFKNEKGTILKKTNRYAERIGPVPGVEVKDWFEYRAELVIAGVHRHLHHGIDSIECQGRRFATCVVAMEGHYDRMNDPDVLWYGGEGGGSGKNKGRVDQVMKGGNLAMKNSIEVRNEVRVVRGVRVPWKGRNDGKVVYVYDGLYEVVGWKTRKGVEGNSVIEFEMKRKPGQPSINWKDRSKLVVL